MKKMWGILIIVIMIFALCSCLQNSDDENKGKTSVAQNEHFQTQVEKVTVNYCYVCGQNEVSSPDEFCSSCKCGLCNYPKTVDSLYCDYHKCKLCRNSKAGNSLFCVRHKCKDGTCVEIKSDGEYCIKHTCIHQSCKNRKDTNSNYCGIHK